MAVTLLVPTLNEFTGMQQIMPRVDLAWCDQILVADGGSSDGTVDYAREHGYDVFVQQKKGIRHAYIEAMPRVKGNVVITFSPDGNCIPEVIPLLVAKMAEGYDMVIASRYYNGLTSDDDDWLTRLGNWGFTRSINLLHGGHYTDAMGIFRAWKRELFTQLDLDQESSYAVEKLFRTVIGVEPLLSIRAAKRGLSCADIPAREPARIGGERKLQIISWGGAYMLQVLTEVFFWRTGSRR